MRDYDAIKEALTFYAATAETTRKTRALLDAADAIEELVAQRDGLLASALELMHREDLLRWFGRDKYNSPPDDTRPVGKWIRHDNYGWNDTLECSCCAEEYVVYDGEFPGVDSFKYCPNCGAKMEVPANEN